MPGYQMKEHHAERIHVACRHSALAENLLRRGVLEREATPGELRQVGRLRVAIRDVKRGGDSEVEQPIQAMARRSHRCNRESVGK